MHLSYEGRERERLWNYAQENNLIGLSHPRFVTEDWNKIGEDDKRSLSPIWIKQFDMFCNEINIGDIVLVLSGWDSLLGIAEVTESCYHYDRTLSEDTPESFFDHIRRVQWHRTRTYTNRLQLPQPVRGFLNTLFKVEPETQRWLILINVDI